ncbi:MAG: porin family protein [Candidatus Aminicenantes bacterium]|nr:porin family protein [Candidatus Aminicenantes bacterium]
MRKAHTCFFMFFLFTAVLYAGNREMKGSRLSVTGGAYFMQDEVFKEVYGDSAWAFYGEYSYRLPFILKQHIEIGVEYRFLSDKGKLTVTKEEVDLMMSDITFSLRYLFDLKRFIPFIGPGLDYIMYKEKYPPTFPVSSTKGSVLGFSFQGGCYYDFSSSLGAKVCVKYSHAQTEEGEVTADIGGIGITAGLVFRFNL